MNKQSNQSIDGLMEESIREGFSRGEEWAFEAVAKEHFSHIVNFINNLLHDRDKAVDLAQESFFLACRAHKRYNPKRRLAPWLFQIARNLAYKEYNRLKKHTVVSLDETMEETGFEPESNTASPRRQVFTEETQKRLKQAINKLKPKYRDIIILRIVQGLPSERVSVMLDLPVSTINTRTHRGLQLLRKLAKQEGIREDEVFS